MMVTPPKYFYCAILTRNIVYVCIHKGEVTFRFSETTSEGTHIVNLQVFPDVSRNISLAANRRYEIVCSYTAAFDKENSWKKDGSAIVSSDNITLISTMHERSLVFNNFSSEHVGLYQCVFPGGSRELRIEESKCTHTQTKRGI